MATTRKAAPKKGAKKSAKGKGAPKGRQAAGKKDSGSSAS